MNTAASPSAQEQLDLYQATRTDPRVLMFEDLVPKAGEKCIYLTTTFSDTKHVHKQLWHHEGRKLLRGLGYQGLILIPEHRVNHGGNRRFRHLSWCHEALSEACNLIFYFKKNQPVQEVQQIIHQLGIALGRRSLGGKQTIWVIAHAKQIPCPMTKHYLRAAEIPIFQSLPELTRHLLRM